MLMTACTSRGLLLSDLDNMTIGQAVDFVIAYNNSVYENSEETEQVKIASQEDIDLL